MFFGLDRSALLFLSFVALIELAIYATDPNSPFTAPSGTDWYGWWDQGQYFKSAWAFAHGNLSNSALPIEKMSANSLVLKPLRHVSCNVPFDSFP